MRRALLAALIAAGLLAGCGGDDNLPEGGAVGLTEWLPEGGAIYAAVDVTAYKDEFDLPEDADPTTETELARVMTAAFAALLVDPLEERGEGSAKPDGVLEAVGPEAITAAAFTQMEEPDGVLVAAYATTADVGEIGSRLGDLGYRDSGGVLEGAPGEPAIRLGDGLVFVSDSLDALQDIPDEQRDDPPLELLAELEGDDVAVYRVDDECFTETGAATEADGSAQVGVLIPGGGEPERLSGGGDVLGEPQADGDLVTAPVDTGGDAAAARAILAQYFVGYDCE